MQKRPFGRTGLEVSLLTFGCGAVGGLMVKGEARDQDRAVAWARDNGINHFDTAPSYGNGASETNLGRALGGHSEDVIISTKVGLRAEDRADIETAIRASLEASLKRLGREQVDLFQLHNRIAAESSDAIMGVKEVLDEVVPVLESLRAEGKTQFLGFTANGETDALHQLVRSGRFDSAQVFFNMLAPSAGKPVAAGYPAQDYRELLQVADETGVGTIGVRVLAGGALSGREERHPLGAAHVQPIGSGRDYATDVARARRFQPLVDAGHAADLPELAIRYAIAHPSLSTTEIGIANLEQLQQAAEAVNKGPLTPDVVAEIDAIHAAFASEER